MLNNKIIFIINSNFILTIHEGKIDAISEFLKNLEIDTTLPDQLQIKHTDLLSFYLVKNLYINLKEQLLSNNILINEIKTRISKKQSKIISDEIFNKTQNLIKIEETINSHEKIIESMSKSLVQIFGDKFQNYSSVMTEIFYEIKSMISSQNKSLINLYYLNNTYLLTKNSKKITLITSISIISMIVIILIAFYVITHI